MRHSNTGWRGFDKHSIKMYTVKVNYMEMLLAPVEKSKEWIIKIDIECHQCLEASFVKNISNRAASEDERQNDIQQLR